MFENLQSYLRLKAVYYVLMSTDTHIEHCTGNFRFFEVFEFKQKTLKPQVRFPSFAREYPFSQDDTKLNR